MKIPHTDWHPEANNEAPHDNKDGPCKCGAWHKPSEFETEAETFQNYGSNKSIMSPTSPEQAERNLLSMYPIKGEA